MPTSRNAGDKISSLNDHFLCAKCFAKFQDKELLARHIKTCNCTSIVCSVCGLQFKHNANLARHKQSHSKQPKILTNCKELSFRKCDVCDDTFRRNKYKNHIRRKHFSRSGKIYECFNKCIGDVWVERVINTNFSVEMRKVAKNLIVIKKITTEEDVFVKPDACVKTKCTFCNKLLRPHSMPQHILDQHSGGERKFNCDNCTFTSNRSHDLKRHLMKCGRPGFRSRVKYKKKAHS